MKISKNAVITFLTVLLVVGILFFIIFGCMSFSYSSSTEHFADKKKAKKAVKTDTEDKSGSKEDDDNSGNVSVNLTSKEKELFEDLKDNKLSTEQITDLVKGGVLTEKLVEKFLSVLNVPAADNAKEVDMKPKKKQEDEDGIEGFVVGTNNFAKF